ncbi:uroporphyrinogen-III synthase [Oceanobacillus chungangensis]|uniref:Uroporphyrinogen-III synthase n=1 Tax=Oceanobacillus chungangensis TaxID=1229152 RepID=A0A3D8Q095_9BACI|nr:uroporphyrinogen-III synthase [Oceanobacillus chungangensis]RDW21653.1 uroporphyrinogen-III synthase [Oceanobacillus chungangensis]
MAISLQNKKIVITREAGQAKLFSEKILKHGGIPIEMPLLKISVKDHIENANILRNLATFEWIFFTSANGVSAFFTLASRYEVDLEKLHAKKFAVVGHKTEDVLNTYGFTADFIPTVYNAETMASEFLAAVGTVDSILLVRGNRSLAILPTAFSENDVIYAGMEVYETVFNEDIKKALNQLLTEDDYDFITFTSPSCIEAYHEMAKEKVQQKCVCIGTTTERRAIELGFTDILTAEEFTIDGMIEAMSNYLRT